MKKFLLVVVIAAVVAGGIYSLYYFGFLGAPYAEKILPQNTAACVFLRNTRQAVENFQKTALGKRIQESPRKANYIKLAQRAYVSLESVTGIDVRPELSQFTGDLAVGAYPMTSGRVSVAFLGYVRDEGDFRKDVEQQIDPSMKRRLPDLKKIAQRYNGVDYFKYMSSKLPPGLQPCYFITDHHFVLASSEEGIRQLLDVRAGNVQPIKKNPDFQDARKSVAYSRGIFLYLNTAVVTQALQSYMPADARATWAGIVKLLGVDGLRWFAYELKADGDGFAERAFVSVSRQRQGLLKIYMDQKPVRLQGLDAVPGEAKVVSAGTLPDFARMWDEINAELSKLLTPAQYGRWQQALNMLRGLFNFDIRRDLLQPVGNEITFASEPGSPDGDPAKMIYFLQLRLREPDQFKSTLDRVASLGASQGMQKKIVPYKGKNLNEYQFTIGNLTLTPAYYMEGPLFAIASRGDFLERSIDVQAASGKGGIRDKADFNKVTTGFPADMNGLSYTDVQTVFGMTSRMLAKEAAAEDSAWIREYGLDAELDYLAKGLFGSAAFSRISNDGVEIRSYSSIPRGLLAGPSLIANLPKILRAYNTRH